MAMTSLSIGCLVLVTLAGAFDEDSINRIQYGILFERLSDFPVLSSDWIHSFVIPIPEIVKPDPFLLRARNITQTDWDKCLNVLVSHVMFHTENNRTLNIDPQSACAVHPREIILLLESYKSFVQTVIFSQDKMNSLLPPELDLAKMSKKREGPILPFIGEITSSLFGLATTGQINKVIKHVNQITKTQATQTATIQHTLADLSSFRKIFNDRLNLAVNMTNKLSQEFTVHMNEFRHNANSIIDIMMVTREISYRRNSLTGASIRVLSHLDQYIRGLEFLKTGFLTVDLIPIKHMTEVIKGIQNSLNREHPLRRFYVSYGDPLYYYTKPMHFIVTRNHTNLIIGLKIPLSAYEKPFNAYKINYYPLAIPKNHKDSLMIDQSWKGLAINAPPQGHDRSIAFFELDDTDMAELRITQNLKVIKRVMHVNHATNCLMAIYLDKPLQVKRHCHYHIIVNGMTSTLYHLTGAKYYLTHINNYMLCFNIGDDRKYFNSTKCDTTCVINVPDDCTLYTDNYRVDHAFGIMLPKQMLMNEQYLASIPVLLQFLPEKDIKTLSGSKLYSEKVEITIPPIEVYKNPLADKLPEDNIQKLSLTKAISNLKNDEKIIGSLADSIILGQTQIAPRPTSPLDVTSILSTIVVRILVVQAIYCLYKIRMLTMALALINKPSAYAQSGDENTMEDGKEGRISFHLFPSATKRETTTQDIHSVMQASIASNWIFILFALAIIAAIGAVGLYIYRKYCITFRKISPHCSLSLQFSIRQDNVFIKLCSIVAVQEDLIIICKQWIEDVNLIGCISPQLNFAWRAKLWNNFTDQATKVPQYISVKYWDAVRPAFPNH